MMTTECGQRCRAASDNASSLCALFCHECGFHPLPWMFKTFGRLLAEGFTFDLLEEIISRTARAPRPSWAYMSAILDNCRTNGAYNLLSFLAIQRPKKAFSDQPRRVSAQMYKQREYTENELGGLGNDLIQEVLKNRG